MYVSKLVSGLIFFVTRLRSSCCHSVMLPLPSTKRRSLPQRHHCFDAPTRGRSARVALSPRVGVGAPARRGLPQRRAHARPGPADRHCCLAGGARAPRARGRRRLFSWGRSLAFSWGRSLALARGLGVMVGCCLDSSQPTLGLLMGSAHSVRCGPPRARSAPGLRSMAHVPRRAAAGALLPRDGLDPL